MEDYTKCYNQGNDCDYCYNQYRCGRDGDEIGCRCADNGDECCFIESDEY